MDSDNLIRETIRELNDKLENWNYEKLDETNRIAKEIKEKLS